ncbi:phage cell wall peptidase, NlpC/P60 family [Rhizobium sp. PDO1-076]|uniref:NlpC/P60 family protein n=1 Tax=Rhizobium sp. PDO1-076 TaxID=1125979 RepID=UPI00024E2E8A|nr:NlpC/P60 family protein [Rhizobium sp. PDO1-076]EHS52920.1 phage cell wall peptidase, NlpC/P60 family [Rhizobium sp. PDO1-076]
MTINARVLGIAEQWIGTPYRHQGSAIGVGCDCLGLVRGIWRGLYGREPELVPAYAADWAERSGEERLLEAAARHFRPVASFRQSLPGDLVIFRFRPGCAAKHAGILARNRPSTAVGECGPDRGGTDESDTGELCPGESGPGEGAEDEGVQGHPAAVPDHFIHAYEQSAVTRSTLVPAWRRRIAGLYRFPEV